MAKRNDDLLSRLLAGLTVRGILLHPATLFVAASAVTIGGAVHLWNGYHEVIVDREDYRLTSEKIQINDAPAWGEADLNQLLLNQLAVSENVSLLDTDLIARTVDTFQNVGWVEQVRKIEKSKIGLAIELKYRGPVGMVEMNGLTMPSTWPKNQDGQLLPVDRQAFIMPGRLVADFPMLRFSVFEPVCFTKLETWTEWPDERIKGCAKISEAIAEHWQPLGLYRIVTKRKPNEPLDSSVPYELWPDSGIRVVWGNPPGEETEAEATAVKKTAALIEFVEKYGPLNTLAKGKIDLRSGTAVAVDVRAAKSEKAEQSR